MKRWMRVCVALGFLFVVAGWTSLAAQEPTTEFVPVTAEELAQQEQIPAAQLVFAAYAFVWVCFVVYLFALWRKLRTVEVELGEIRAKLGGSGR